MTKKAGQIPIKDLFNTVIWTLVSVMLLSCTELEQKYIRRDKFFRIAFLEDSRIVDTLLIGAEFLSDPDPEIRSRTALATGRIGGDLYAEALKRNLRDSIPSTAEIKFFAAGLTGDSGLFDSIFYLAQADTIARARAVEALGRVADTGQAARLSSFLSDADTNVVYQAMLAMWRAGQWSEATKIAGIGLHTGSRKAKYGALYSLARGGRIEGHDLFLAVLSDHDPEFRMLAYMGLGRAADTAAIKQIAGGLNDADHRVVASAMYALRNFGDLGSVFIADKLPGLSDEKLVVLALEIIGEHSGFRGAGDLVGNILKNDGRDNVQAAAARSLLQIEGAKALITVDEQITTPSYQQKFAIAEGLAAIEPSAAKARLTPLFNDDNPLVRAAAMESLCKVDSVSAARYIATALSDSDFVVTTTAVETAAGMGLKSLIPAIAELYLDQRNIIDDDMKRAIIDAWSRFETDPAYDSLVISVLKEGCNDEWFIIRREASQVLWDKFGIDQRSCVKSARSKIEKRNFRKLFYKYEINPTAVLETSRGPITMELFYDDAPMTVNNFISLAEKGFYDNRIFHRVVPNFVIQDGCPRGDGWGGPGYTIRCEYNRRSYTTGTVGMAHAGKDTGGSQYFITLSPQPHLDARYTVFGRVISGMEAAQQIVRGDSVRTVTIHYNREDK